MQIVKRSKKPFKNGEKIATVIGSGIHPITSKPTWILEDNSYVEQRMCKPFVE